MTTEYLDPFQPNILDVHQKIIDVREIPDVRVGGRNRPVSSRRPWQTRRRPSRSGGGWPLLVLIALVVGAVGTHQQAPPAAEQQAAITNPAASTAEPSTSALGQATSATEQGNSVTSDATQAPTAALHTPVKCPTQTGAENSANITLPDVIGQNARAAGEQLSTVGLLNVQMTSANLNYNMVLVSANWTVVSTNPKPCSVITPNDHVVLHVTKPGRGVGSLFEFPWSH
jgi:hypothetical protein